MTEGWNIDQLRRQLLADRATPSIPGLAAPPPAQYRGQGAERYQGGRGGARTLGELVFNSEAWREWKGDRSGRNKAPRSAEFEEFEGLQNIAPDGRLRASNPFNASTEGLTSIQKLPGVQMLDQQPLTIAKLFPQANTNGSTVRYTVEDTYTQAATAVAEGASKPAASLDVSEVDAPVRKIAVYTKVTEEMLEGKPPPGRPWSMGLAPARATR